jgi:hypothetical protein
MEVLGQNFPKLQLLEVPYMRDQGLINELGGRLGKNLQALYFAAHRMEGTAVRDSDLLSKTYPNLLAMGISYPAHLPAKKLVESLRGFQQLVVLKLTGFANATVLSGILDSKYFPHLLMLTISSYQFENQVLF